MFDRSMMGIGEFDCAQKVGGTRYLSDFGQTWGKKEAARWKLADAPNDVLRVEARAAFSTLKFYFSLRSGM